MTTARLTRRSKCSRGAGQFPLSVLCQPVDQQQANPSIHEDFRAVSAVWGLPTSPLSNTGWPGFRSGTDQLRRHADHRSPSFITGSRSHHPIHPLAVGVAGLRDRQARRGPFRAVAQFGCKWVHCWAHPWTGDLVFHPELAQMAMNCATFRIKIGAA